MAKKGQFIFMPLGQTAHGIVKDYLIAHGIPKETVEIINGSINNTTEKKDETKKTDSSKSKKNAKDNNPQNILSIPAFRFGNHIDKANQKQNSQYGFSCIIFYNF